MTPEEKLQSLFAADAAPARDMAFQAGVAQRIARRRAWLSVAAMVPWAIAAVAVLWAMAPAASGLGEALAPAAAVVGGSALVVMTALWGARRLEAA